MTSVRSTAGHSWSRTTRNESKSSANSLYAKFRLAESYPPRKSEDEVGSVVLGTLQVHCEERCAPYSDSGRIAIKIRYGKKIDSSRLKISVDKSQSIQAAQAISRSISPGSRIQKCPVCFSEQFKTLCNIYGFEYGQCVVCETAIVLNPPSDDQLRDIYSSDYYTSSNRKLYANDDILQYRLDNIAGPKVNFVLESIEPRPRSWLDIGCGTGEILKVASDRGLRVVGAETNRMQREFAKKKFGIDIIEEFVTEENIANLGGEFDVISLFSVLEHVLAPNALLKQLSALQKIGNHLVVEVPHFPSLSAASQSTFPTFVNRMMHPPLHLFLFSIKGLQALLERNGYRISHCWFFGQDVYEFLTTMLLVAPSLQGSALERTLLGLVSDFQQVVDECGLSDEMLVIAVKE